MHQNKVALVTGANKGIGHAIASALAASGLTVLVGARDAAMNTALGQAFMRGGWDKVTRLRRDDHEPGPMCWLHTETNCLQMG